MNLEALRRTYSRAVISYENAARAHYIAAHDGLRCVGLAKHRAARALAVLNAAEKAYHDAVFARLESAA